MSLLAVVTIQFVMEVEYIEGKLSKVGESPDYIDIRKSAKTVFVQQVQSVQLLNKLITLNIFSTFSRAWH